MAKPTAAELKAEIVADTTARGYKTGAVWKPDAEIERLLNEPLAGITIRRSDISVESLYAAILVTDYAALPGTPTAAQLSTERRYLAWLSGLVAFERVRLQNADGTDTPALTNLKAMFAAGTPTGIRIAALATRLGSRAEQLWGEGTRITHLEVAEARELP